MPTPTASLEDVLPLVEPNVLGAPRYLTLLHLRQAAIELCERSRCWRHMATHTLTDNEAVVAVPPYATIHAIEHAEWESTRLEPVAFTDLQPNAFDVERDPDTGLALSAGSPRFVTQIEDDRLSVIPFAPGTLTVSLFLKPRQGSAPASLGGRTVDALDRIPAFLFRQHAATLAQGALARLLALDGQPWANGPLAMAHRADFVARCASLMSASLRGRQRAPLRSHTQWF